MKKTIVLLFLSLITVFAVNAQDEEAKADSSSNWDYSFRPGLSYSGNSFKDWIKGGNDLVAAKFDSRGIANFENERFIWKNTLLMDYGFTKKRGQKVMMNVDKLDLSSRLSLINSKKSFMYTVFLGLRSQFSDGYNYQSSTQWLLQSSFFAPGYITADLGIDYMEIKNLNIHLSPFAEKTTIVREAFYQKKVINEYWGGYEPEFMPREEDHMQPEEFPLTDAELAPYELRLDTTYESFGLEWRENARFEIGSNIQFLYDNPDFYKFLGVKSRLDIFISYANILKPDIDWETWLSLNINDYFAFNINFELTYDYDIKFQENDFLPDGTPVVRNVPRLQLRNFLGFGVAYTFK